MTHSPQLKPLAARRSQPLGGRARVPGDKSISHRALILGALAVGETRISGLLESEDVLNTAQAMRQLGARVERQSDAAGDDIWSVRGVGVGGFRSPAAPLDFGNSGTGCRLVMGAVAGNPVTATFDGDASLRSRPMRRIVDPLALMGARVVAESEGGRLPLTLEGARDPLPIEYRSPVASAQIKSAVLLAGLAAPGVTTVIEPEASRDHTELMLTHFGAQVASKPEGARGRRISLTGQPELHGAGVVVPADPSSAAFPIVAALIVPESDIVIDDVMYGTTATETFALDPTSCKLIWRVHHRRVRPAPFSVNRGVGYYAGRLFRGTDDGRFLELTADRYMGSGPEARLERWRIPASEWRRYSGVVVPSRGDVIWELAAGDFSYYRWELTSLEYDRAELLPAAPLW